MRIASKSLRDGDRISSTHAFCKTDPDHQIKNLKTQVASQAKTIAALMASHTSLHNDLQHIAKATREVLTDLNQRLSGLEEWVNQAQRVDPKGQGLILPPGLREPQRVEPPPMQKGPEPIPMAGKLTEATPLTQQEEIMQPPPPPSPGLK